MRQDNLLSRGSESTEIEPDLTISRKARVGMTCAIRIHLRFIATVQRSRELEHFGQFEHLQNKVILILCDASSSILSRCWLLLNHGTFPDDCAMTGFDVFPDCTKEINTEKQAS